MKKFFVVLCCLVIVICGGYLANYFIEQNGNSNVSPDGENYYLSWDVYPGASEYNIYINGQFAKTVNTTKADITEYLIDDKSIGDKMSA